MAQTLPPREANLFKQIGRYHEKKQFKKALRCADDILKVNKEHGETLAMKGLTLNSLEKKKEAYECGRLGLRYNISSPICWHVLGLIYRSDRNYEEAKKCYLNAMKRDKNNQALLRDLSLLQVQLRDLNGFLRTKKALLHMKPGRPESWYTLSMAWELIEHYDEAIDVMLAFEEITEGSQRRKNEDNETANFELGERKLFIVRLFEQAGRYQEALDYLAASENQIVDKHGANVIRASLLLKVGKLDEAKTAYEALLDINPENYQFHTGIQKAQGIDLSAGACSEEQAAKLKELYGELAKKYPRGCNAVKRIPLSFAPTANGDFLRYLDAYLQPFLQKGIPSLFATLKEFYQNAPDKVAIIGDRVNAYYTSLKSNHSFPDAADGEEQEAPSTLLWTILFLAQHYDRLGQTTRALELIDEAIAHTPTIIEIYVFRAKIWKHAGDFNSAADSMDEARKLDLADRYLNTKTTVYLMRADRVEQADETIELFTKDADDHHVSLSEMQCVWYEQNAADSYLRTKQYGKALKKVLSIDTHFQDFIEDQFDFHSYCIRKLTLRAYYDLLRFEDKLYQHENYFNAARTAVRAYLAIHERPVTRELTEEELFQGLSGAELRKAKNKYRKAQRIKEAEAKRVQEAKDKELQKQQGKKKPENREEDPEGKALESVENPLDHAAKFIAQMEKWCSKHLDTHLLSFEVYFRKGKFLLALRALKRSLALAPEHPQVHLNKVRLASAKVDDLSELTKQIFTDELNKLTGGASAQKINEEFSSSKNDAESKIASLQAELVLDASSKDKLKEQFLAVHSPSVAVSSAILHTIEKIYGSDVAQQYKDECHNLLPHASAFKPASATEKKPESD